VAHWLDDDRLAQRQPARASACRSRSPVLKVDKAEYPPL